MDLVSNAPLKFGIRRRRCVALFEYMQDWKIKRLEQLAKPEEERVLPPFSPPKPKLVDGLLCLFDVFNTDMKAEKYQEGMARCFVKSGQFPDENGNFYKYYSHEHSGLHIAKDIGTPITDDSQACTLSESLAELEIVPRPEVRESTSTNDLSDASSDDEELEEYANIA